MLARGVGSFQVLHSCVWLFLFAPAPIDEEEGVLLCPMSRSER